MKAVPLNRVNSVLLCGILICIVLFYAKQVLIPVTAAVMLAMLVTPLAGWLERKGVGRAFSTLLCVLLVLLVLAAVMMLIVTQGKSLASQVPKMQEKVTLLLQQAQSSIEAKWNISPEKQVSFVKEQSHSFLQSSGSFLKTFLTGTTAVLGGFVLIIVFMFLLLYQREKYETFLLKLYKGDDPDRAKEVINKTSKVAQHYLVGRLISVAILTALYTIGLVAIGIENAFLLSFIAALLTIVPYVGSIIGGLFPFMVALVTEDSFTPAMWTLGVIVFVQSIDNYFIEPYVVGGEVNISAFFTILILAVGGFVWGVAGMILFIPLLGIAKIVFDHVDELQPYGYLVGDQQEGRQSSRLWNTIKKKLGIKK
jgi:predicted PurR-regulated permease PerM